MNVYAAQHTYFEESTASTLTAGQFASQISDLDEWLDLELMEHVVSHASIQLGASKDSFLAILYSRDGAYQATIRDDRFLLVNESALLPDMRNTRSS